MPAPNKNKADKVLSGDEFSCWIESRQLSPNDVAEWWGVHPKTIRYYMEHGVTKIHALAIAAVERGLDPWMPTDVDWQAIGRQPPTERPPS